MGPPGFEPESQAPKAQRIDQATLRSQDIIYYVFITYKYNSYLIQFNKIYVEN